MISHPLFLLYFHTRKTFHSIHSSLFLCQLLDNKRHNKKEKKITLSHQKNFSLLVKNQCIKQNYCLCSHSMGKQKHAQNVQSFMKSMPSSTLMYICFFWSDSLNSYQNKLLHTNFKITKKNYMREQKKTFRFNVSVNWWLNWWQSIRLSKDAQSKCPLHANEMLFHVHLFSLNTFI